MKREVPLKPSHKSKENFTGKNGEHEVVYARIHAENTVISRVLAVKRKRGEEKNSQSTAEGAKTPSFVSLSYE